MHFQHWDWPPIVALFLTASPDVNLGRQNPAAEPFRYFWPPDSVVNLGRQHLPQIFAADPGDHVACYHFVIYLYRCDCTIILHISSLNKYEILKSFIHRAILIS